ncbi:MAG: DUF4386 family protein [Dehalococcoidia bacterium]|nr:DUF4386 family protein [Dehalococcoidia bacterium]
MNRWIGVLFVVFPIVVVATVIVQVAAVGDGPDPAKDKIAESLADIHDNEGAFLVAQAFDIATNVLAAGLAAAAYLLFRGRNRPLALLAFTGILASALLFMLADVGDFTVTRLADDLAQGDAGGAGGGEILDLARAIVMLSEFATMNGGTFLALGLIALGALLVWAPQSGGASEAASTIPRWIGWVAGLSGVLIALIWLSAAERDLFIVPTVGFLGSFVALLGLAWWLLKAQPEPAAVD